MQLFAFVGKCQPFDDAHGCVAAKQSTDIPAGKLEVRIIGVNTPESDECFSDEATDALGELVAGNDFVLVVDRSDVDQFASLSYGDSG